MADLANQIWTAAANAASHSLSLLVYTPPDPNDDSHTGIIPTELDASITARLPPISTVNLLRYINVCVDDFIALVQGGPAYRLGFIFRKNSIFFCSFLSYPAELNFPILPENGK